MLRDFSAVFAKLLKNQLVGCIYFVSGLNVIYVFTNCTLKTQFYSLFWFGHRLAILTEKVRILKGKSRWADGGNRTHDLVITNDLLYHWATSACWERDLHSCSPFGRLVYSQVRLTTPPSQRCRECEPTVRFELTTCCLQNSCSTTELSRRWCNFTRNNKSRQ